jgi:hypothetical protein
VSLVFPLASYTSEVKKHSPVLSSWKRLSNATNICTSAAQSIVTQTLHLADHNVRSVILDPNAPFLASIVLAVHMLRQPGTRLARADLELFNLTTDYLRDQYSRWAPNAVFIDAGAALRQRMNTIMHPHGAQRHAAVLELTTGRDEVTPTGFTDEQTAPDDEHPLISSAFSAPAPYAGCDFPSDPFEHLPLDELWNIAGFEFQSEEYQMLMLDSPS